LIFLKKLPPAFTMAALLASATVSLVKLAINYVMSTISEAMVLLGALLTFPSQKCTMRQKHAV
jgi:hypothetical protein